MTSKTFMAEAFERATGPVDAEVAKRAAAKLKRHIRNKYGSIDWQSEFAECGVSNFWHFYEETLKAPDGRRTFNNGF